MGVKRSHNHSFKREYEVTWPVLKRSKMSDDYVYCTVCDTDFTITHGGKADCRRHMDGQLHKNNAEMETSDLQLTNMSAETTDLAMAVRRAEALFAEYIVEHNWPLSAAADASLLFPRMFPDSEIAKNISSERIIEKATALYLAKKDGDGDDEFDEYAGMIKSRNYVWTSEDEDNED